MDAVCCPRSAASAPPAGRFSGRDAWELANDATSPVLLRRAVGAAALNSLSCLAVDRWGTPGGTLLSGLDALEAADIQPGDRVALVGAFAPFVRVLKGRAMHVLAGIRVLDGPRLVRIVGERGSGYFFQDAAEKVAVIRHSPDGSPPPSSHVAAAG